MSDTRFKVYGGNESSCHNLRGERPEEHLTCEQYNKGGAEGPLGCDDDWMKAHSARLPDWTQLRCLTWPETNCAGDNNQGSDDNCVKAPGSLGIKSFQCVRSGIYRFRYLRDHTNDKSQATSEDAE